MTRAGRLPLLVVGPAGFLLLPLLVVLALPGFPRLVEGTPADFSWVATRGGQPILLAWYPGPGPFDVIAGDPQPTVAAAELDGCQSEDVDRLATAAARRGRIEELSLGRWGRWYRLRVELDSLGGETRTYVYDCHTVAGHPVARPLWSTQHSLPSFGGLTLGALWAAWAVFLVVWRRVRRRA